LKSADFELVMSSGALILYTVCRNARCTLCISWGKCAYINGPT